MAIDQSEFDHWKEHPITRRLYLVLHQLDEDLKHSMLNLDVLMEPKGELVYARGAGNRDVLQRMFDLVLEDILTEEDIDDTKNI